MAWSRWWLSWFSPGPDEGFSGQTLAGSQDNGPSGFGLRRKVVFLTTLLAMNDHPAPITLETERLWLRPTGIQDAAFWLQLVNSPKWLRYIGDRQIRTEEEARQHIRERMEPQLRRYGYGNFTLFLKPDRIPVGVCGLYKREGLEAVDIGFALLPEWEGRSLAGEAARAVMEAGVRRFRLPLICAITTPDNEGSRRILESLEMSFVRIIRIPGDDADLMYYEKRCPE